MSNRISLAFLLLALSGCDTTTVIGDRNDTGTMTDAGPRTDDAYSATDAYSADDAHRVADDAYMPDAFVVHGTGQFVSIGVSTTHPAFSSTPMDRFDIQVRVQATEEGGSTPTRLIERSGACEVNGVGTTPAAPPPIAVASVTAQVGSGAVMPLTFNAMQGYALNMAPPPVGTPIIIRVDMGMRTIERTLTVRDLRMTTPAPVPAAVQWRATYTTGSDVRFTWPTASRSGDFKLIGVWDPAFINSAPERRSMTCSIDASATTFSVPWALFNTHLVDPAASSPMVWLVNSESQRALEGDVTVVATSAALSEFVTLNPM